MTKNNSFPRGRREKLDKKTAWRVFVRLSRYVLSYWWLFIPAVIFTLISNSLSLLGPRYSGKAIDAIVNEAGVQFHDVWVNVAYMLICYLAAALLSYILSVIMVFLSQKIVYKMRKQLFIKLTALPVSYFDTHPTGDIISRISYDIDTVNSSLSHDLVQVMTSLYTVIGSLIFMWQISKPLILVFCITVPISILFTKYRAKKIRPLYSTRTRKLGELNGYAEEMLSGTRAVYAYNRQKQVDAIFEKKNEDTMQAYYEADFQGATLAPVVNFINNFSLSLVMMFGGILYMMSVSGAVKAGTLFFITLGGIAQFVQYSRKFAGPINEFANILNEFQSTFSAAERVFRILDEEEEKADSQSAVPLHKGKGDVAFENVRFSYTDKEILHGISLDVKSGETVAIVGPTGAGKTTIINLLMRFYDADSGRITIDGRDIRDFTRKSLRQAFTMVLQDTFLFGGTIFENIAYGKEGATLDEVKAAAKAARIDRYIESLQDAYDTVLLDEGSNISGGQKQLITIARAMLADTPLLILDEATSSVDSRTEIKIQKAMNDLLQGRTSFVIAHRLSTVQNADKILVLQNGYITEAGTHTELLQKGGFYSTLYNSQFV